MTDIRFSSEGVEAKYGTETRVHPWSEIEGLFFPFFGDRPYIRVRRYPRLKLEGEASALSESILAFYANWTEKFPEAAKKNAFDYAEPQKSGAWMMLSTSVLFCFVLAGILFQESWTQARCSALLSANPTVAPAEIVRLRKRQQGNFTVGLKFMTANGEWIEGKRLTLRKYAAGEPDPKEFTVIYPPERPSCWVLSETAGQNDINWAKRRYTTAFNFLVAIAFALVGAAFAVMSVIRLRQTRPAALAVAKKFQINIG